jgi:hypothetical protein
VQNFHQRQKGVFVFFRLASLDENGKKLYSINLHIKHEEENIISNYEVSSINPKTFYHFPSDPAE